MEKQRRQPSSESWAKETGKETVVAGNIGIALSGQVDNLEAGSIIVAELSSFQLEFIDKLRVNIAVVLNLTPDHLDRHETMDNYAAAKARILENQTELDLAVLNWDDEKVRKFAEFTKARIMYFSSKEHLDNGICLEEGNIVLRKSKKTTKIVGYKELLIRGTHNIENAMAAITAALEMGLGIDTIARVLRRFQPVKHRQEIVGTFNGILYINDSKGTNPDSSIKALQSYEEQIVLLQAAK
jgi:UDP-N-acetylmuramoylalanine--D-glutamate ligase